VPVAISEAYERGAEGAQELAEVVMGLLSGPKPTFSPLYPLDLPLVER